MSGVPGWLAAIRGATVERDVPMERLTTWRVGGPVEYLVTARERTAVARLMAASSDASVPVVVIGNGSNVLVADSGLKGVALRLAGDLAGVSAGGTRIDAGAGAPLAALARRAAASGLGGLEFASGIPGTAGGATMTNAGCFGSCWSDVVQRIEAVDRQGNEVVHERPGGSYREPLVPRDEVVLATLLALAPAPGADVEARMRACAARRRATQPLDVPSAGSVFRNPGGDSAGRLIERCGLKGAASGGARISEVHANFIVNRGGAKASDIMSLIELARSAVIDRFGVRLELEVRLLGFEEE